MGVFDLIRRRRAPDPAETGEPPEKKSTIDDVIARIDSARATASGTTVSDRTALQQAAVWACVRIISESIAQLPISLYQVRGNRSELVSEHDAIALLQEPNQHQDPHEFWSMLIAWSEIRGNAYARVLPGQLLPVASNLVTLHVADGVVTYTLSDYQAGIHGTHSSRDVFHLRNFALDWYEGISTIGYARESIGLALQTEAHGASIFKNGAQLGRVFTHPSSLSDDAYRRLKADLEKHYTGADKAGKSIILEDGMNVHSTAMTAEDAQFLETRKFQTADIARIFGVPLVLLNDTEKSTTWGSGLEQIMKSFLRFTLAPRLSRIQHALGRQLLTARDRREGLQFKHDTTAFEVGDFRERMDGFRAAIESGVYNPNEVRGKLGENPRDGGDDYVRPVNIAAENELAEGVNDS
jgi:HK97 family phage portal protein